MTESTKLLHDLLNQNACEKIHASTLQDRVQDLCDRDDIRELTAIYAHRVAHGISPANLFTDDGVFAQHVVGGTISETSGRAGLDETFDAISRHPARPMPMIHNHIIKIDGDEATGVCSIELRIAIDGKSIIGSGFYQDRYRRENGKWKFAMRDATLFHMVPIQQGWAETA